MARTGARHASVQRMRRLSRRRRDRDAAGAFVIDGPTLLGEALDHGLAIQEVLAEPAADPALLERCAARGVAVRPVADGVLSGATGTVTPQPVAAVATFHDLDLDGATSGLAAAAAAGAAAEHPLVLVLVGVNDPGNVGTLLRAARAVGAAAVLCCDGTADLYNPKAVRASAGALFDLRVVREAGSGAALVALQEAGLRGLGAVARGGDPHDRADLTGPVALVLGSEAHGLAREVRDRLDGLVTISLDGPESLNVAMAGTVLGFEARRQRRARAGTGDGV